MSVPSQRPIVTTFALISFYSGIIEKLCRIIVNLVTSQPSLLHDETGILVVGSLITVLLAMGLTVRKIGQGSLKARRVLVVLQFSMYAFPISCGATLQTYAGNISFFPDVLGFLMLFQPESTAWLKRKAPKSSGPQVLAQQPKQ
jgi:hypothetical protein